jgi:uracil-DNA glycosylase
VGKLHRGKRNGVSFDLAPLPHPSGASTWQYMEPGKTLLKHALALIAEHAAWKKVLLATKAKSLTAKTRRREEDL